MQQETVIQFNNVSFSYSDKPLLEAVSFEIEIGSFVGVVGPNGGGKTTLIKLLLGELIPQRGSASILDKSPIQSRTDIGYLSQRVDIDYDFPITAFEVVMMGNLSSDAFKFYSDDDRKRVEEAMKKLAVWDLRDKFLGEMSGGEKQRVLLSRALVMNPKILILDEPLVNVDIETQIEFYKILSDLNKEMGLTILVVDHNLEMLLNYVTKVLCINKCEREHVKLHDLDDLTREEILKL